MKTTTTHHTPFGALGRAFVRLIDRNDRVARLKATPRDAQGVTRSDVHYL